MTQKKLETYLNLCTQVYDLSKPKPPEDAYALYRSYALQAKGPILEPMCGSGRFLVPMLEEGFEVHGFDASDHMLEALHAKAKVKNLEATVWKGFIEDLKRPEKYNLIFIPGGSFCLMIDLESAKAALQTFYDHLSDDGVLVFEIITLKWKAPQPKVWTGDVWYREDGKLIVMSSFALPDTDNIRHSISRYELVDDGQVVQAEIEDFKVRLYDPKDVITLLNNIGFKDIKMIKAFDVSAIADKNDEVIVYECRK